MSKISRMKSSSSSDSDAGERVKNVESVIVKSKANRQETDVNYAYKRKLGDLIFNANFEAGNLGYVEQVDQYDYDLMVRPDVANPRHRLWFNFSVSNQRPNQCVIFTFVNLSDDVGLFHEGLTPVVRSRQQPNWLRLHEDQVFYYRSPNHGDRYVLSLAFRFITYDNEHQFALFYPYAYTTLISFVTRWTVELKRSIGNRKPSVDSAGSSPMFHRRHYHHPNRRSPELYERQTPDALHQHHLRAESSLGFSKSASRYRQLGEDVNFKVDLIGTSILSKSIYMLSIKGTSESRFKTKVIILCRSGGNLDSAASFVCQGLIDYMLSDSLIARTAIQYMDFVIFPMVDPDSICAGNTRTDILGQSNISPKMLLANKSVYANYSKIYEIVERICSQESRVILIELRVNLNLIGSRVMGTHYDDSMRMERHLSLPRLFARFTNDFYLEKCEFSKPSSCPTYLFNLGSGAGVVDRYRMEVSPFAFYKRSLMERIYDEYDQQKYLSLGKAMVYSLLELLRPKDNNLPHCVAAILDSFHPKADDIDDLLLKF